ncbi:MAG: M23 family metallopeptidase [Prevotellaceae bacterium]|jgi:murein DD-endopeptidase MepM/ murein hydrolase activator NlpD|nr:M23 family metallopeptidase [Prevotellaceae bacterium]
MCANWQEKVKPDTQRPKYLLKKQFLYSLVFLLSVNVSAQEGAGYFRWPVDGAISLSANYGELRSNHFHAGLDIRVGGVPGMPVYAAADGYVSRIAVRPDGYGRAVYITHPNGTTSVYAHLHTFAPALKAYIEAIQYARQRYTVDEQIAANVLPVKKGQLIGAAGNSGSSAGAHLHFEIRHTDTETPRNVFSYGYYPLLTDTYAPVIRRVAFFSFRRQGDIPSSANFYERRNPARRVQQTVHVPDTFYIGIDAYDSQNGTPAKLAVNRALVTLDGATVFSCRFEDISFDAMRYINSAIAYEERQRNNKVFLKTYIAPGNRLQIYRDVQNSGLISLPDTLPHTMEIKVIDDAGNHTATAFTVQKKPGSPASLPVPETGTIPVAHWDTPAAIVKEGLSVSIPAGALYQPAELFIDTIAGKPDGAYSPLWRIHTPETPLHYAMTLKIAADMPDTLFPKALIAGITGNHIYSCGGQWKNNAVETSTRSFGDFFVTVDTIAPVITPAFAPNAYLGKQAQLRIKITDNLSGIGSYSGYIDDEWALFEYDAKNRRLLYTFDARRIKRGRKHRLLLSVTDNKGNTATLQTAFTW